MAAGGMLLGVLSTLQDSLKDLDSVLLYARSAISLEKYSDAEVHFHSLLTFPFPLPSLPSALIVCPVKLPQPVFCWILPLCKDLRTVFPPLSDKQNESPRPGHQTLHPCCISRQEQLHCLQVSRYLTALLPLLTLPSLQHDF